MNNNSKTNHRFLIDLHPDIYREIKRNANNCFGNNGKKLTVKQYVQSLCSQNVANKNKLQTKLFD